MTLPRQLALHRGDRRVRHQLCGVFRRDLPRRHRVHQRAGSMRPRRCSATRKAQTFFQHHPAADGKARACRAVTNEVITLVKDTSLASVIGTVEMFTRAKQIAACAEFAGHAGVCRRCVFSIIVFNYALSPSPWSGSKRRSPTTAEGGPDMQHIGTAPHPQKL